MLITPVKSRCHVEILDFQSYADGNCKYILVYEDCGTKFVILRPLETQTIQEVATVLLDIFLLFGAPCVLQSDSSREFCKRIIEKLEMLWPELKMVDGKPKGNDNESGGERAYQDIPEMVTTWMQSQNSYNWSFGLKFIQFMKNRALRCGMEKSPYESVFGCSPRIGLSSYNIPDIVVHDIFGEENLETVLKTVKFHTENDCSSLSRSNNTKECVYCQKGIPDIVCGECYKPLHFSCSNELVLSDKTVRLCIPCLKNNESRVYQEEMENLRKFGYEEEKLTSIKQEDDDDEQEIDSEHAIATDSDSSENVNMEVDSAENNKLGYDGKLEEPAIHKKCEKENISVDKRSQSKEQDTEITREKPCIKEEQFSDNEIEEPETEEKFDQRKPDDMNAVESSESSEDVDDGSWKEPEVIIKTEPATSKQGNSSLTDHPQSKTQSQETPPDGSYNSTQPNEAFQCDQCEASFPSEQKLNSHICVQTNTQSFVCYICDEACETSYSLIDHVQSKHAGDKPLSCVTCKKSFSCRQALLRHIRVHAGVKPHECPECHKTYSRQEHLARHLRTHSVEKPFVCDICKVGFAIKEALENHIVMHKEEKSFECPMCNRRFTHHGYLMCHLRSHSYEKKYECTTCKEEFSHQGLFLKHMKMHTEDKTCSICNKVFVDKETLAQHVRIHTGDETYPCTVCDRVFTDKEILAQHAETHRETYPCTICDRVFSDKESLEQHVKKHSEEGPYECSTCKKTFTEQSSLMKHMAVHTEEKTFHCENCEKRFSTWEDLTRHLRTHTGEKPYECTICKKKYTRLESLRVHSRIHSGERPFSCPVCLRTFSYSQAVARHIRTHTGEKPFHCKHCDQRFTHQSTLSKHTRRHHRHVQ